MDLTEAEDTKKRWQEYTEFSSVQLLSRVRLCVPMDCSTPGFPVYHQLLELAQTHVYRVGNVTVHSHLNSDL